MQLLRLRPAFFGADAVYVTVRADYRDDLDGERLHVVRDATRWNKVALLLLAIQILWIVARERPNVVISTGAAPGYFAIRFGRWFGARTLWVDSIANVNALSMTGALTCRHADLVLTQWEHLARPAEPNGPMYHGAIL